MTEYLGNKDNLLTDADVSAMNIVASDAVFRIDTDPKESNADVILSGPYTGQHDTIIDIEILDTAGAETRPSRPTFEGIGNGTLTDIDLIDVPEQSFVIALEDLGTRTQAAYANFQGVVLRAAVEGEDGNDITLTVDPSGLTYAATPFALPADLVEGQNEYVGPAWDLVAPNAPILSAEGFLPVNAPRIFIGSDPQVYRPYRRYVAGRYVYSFSPSPVRTIQKGARVREVTATRTIIIEQGATTETLTGIATLYDALSKIRDESTLVTVDGAITNNRAPGGQGAVELSVASESYSTGFIASGTDFIRRAELGLTVGPDAPSEELTITAYDTARVNAEKWRVEGAVSGRLADATTGVPYESDDYAFTVPIADPPTPGAGTGGSIRVEFIPVDRAEGESYPDFMAIKPRLGIAPVNGTFDFIWSSRPPEECDWRDGTMEGGPRFECLGLDPNDTVGGSLVSEQSRLIRVQRLAAAVREATDENTNPAGQVDEVDLRWIKKSGGILQTCLVELFSTGTLNLGAWAASTAYVLDDMRQPTTTNNAYRYAVSTAGTSGASAPTWGTTVGGTTTDGTVVWTNIGKSPVVMWDGFYDDWKAEVDLLTSVDEPARGIPSVAATSSLTLDAGTPAKTASGGGIYTASATLTAPWGVDEATQFSMIGYAPTMVDADNSVTWTMVGLASLPPDAFFDRYRAWMNEVRAAAGIEPGFDDAGGGDGCWRDFEQDKWFAYQGDAPYMPIQEGHYYHLTVMDQDEDGNPYTRTVFAWGFGPQFGCAENLKNGDKLRVIIEGTSGASMGYQNGDQQAYQIVHSGPQEFGGGQTGSDALTFSVRGSVSGRLADYVLDIETLNAYTYDDPGSSLALGFQITPGGIAFGLGDKFRFDAESGQYRIRYDGGTWSSAQTIVSGALLGGNGIQIAFPGGPAPSYAGGDLWSFRAEAINGPDGLRSLADRQLRWTDGTVIEITPAELDSTITGILIGRHTIGSGATITLTGSDDGFTTTPFSQVIPWAAGDIWFPAEATHDEFRLTITGDGSIDWLYLGEPPTLLTRNGAVEGGRITEKRIRLPGTGKRAGLGMTVEHSFLSKNAIDTLRDLLAYSTEFDNRRLVLVPALGEVAHVRYEDDDLPVTDAFNFEPTNTAKRTQAVSLEFTAA